MIETLISELKLRPTYDELVGMIELKAKVTLTDHQLRK